MTSRPFAMSLFAFVLWFATLGFTHAADCATCSKNLNDCQKPAHMTYVNCMKGNNNASCGSKCAGDCKGKADVQKCTLDCTKSCQGGQTCQKTFSTASAQCLSTYKACKNGCTVTR